MQHYMPYVKCISMAMLLMGCSLFVLKPLAKMLGLMDHPGGRKHHHQSTPLIGGLAIFLGLLISIQLLPIQQSMVQNVLLGSFILLFIGALDDRFDILPRLRLFIQIATIFYLIFIGGFSLNYIGSIFYLPNVHLNYLSIPLTVVLTLGFINAINMLDGQDGLAGSVVFTQALLLFFVSVYLGEKAMGLLLGAFLGVLSVFLFFNMPMPWRRRASIFLGDSGSNFLAFFVAWCVIYLSQIEASVIKPITLIWIVALPFFDMTSACLLRTRQKRSWADAGHDHIHHLLQKRKVPVLQSTIWISLLSLSYGLFGLFLAWKGVSEGLQSYLYLACYGSYLLFTRWLNQTSQDVDLIQSNGVVENA